MIGTRLGPYEITAKLGEGGMGEVYRATDSKLRREVAIKVLPAAFTADPERLARFEREAQLLAQLHHPNIASVFGLEESDGTRALVMELVEGEDLSARIARGPVPVEEAIAIARQIAEALEVAHEKGIVHRDLKPANVKVRADGTVKVLDFGLAKALDPAAGPTSAADLARSPTLMNSPTVTSAALAGGTQLGVILGTAAYMAPEQARGGAVDERADIWAFGVLLYEMLVGRSLFAGDTVSDVLAGVLKSEIDLAALPPATPRALRDLARRCLERNLRRRLHHVGDARIELEELAASADGEETAAGPGTVDRGRAVAKLAAVTVVALALGLGAGWWLRRPAPLPPGAGARWALAIPDGYALVTADSLGIAISDDGRRQVAAVIDQSRVARLLLRSSDDTEPRIVPGTEGASSPFFSPDGESIGFFRNGALYRASAGGGTPIRLAEFRATGAERGATWSDDGFIYFAPTTTSTISRVSANGGPVSEVTKIDLGRDERTHRWPQVLPDGDVVLFTCDTAVSTEFYDDAQIEAVRLATGERKVLVEGASMARYAGGGRLVFARAGSLYTVDFDPATLAVSGSPALVVQGVATDVSSGAAQFAVAASGAAIWVPGGATVDYGFVWIDRAGVETQAGVPEAPYGEGALSADGRRVALIGGSGGLADLWVSDLERGTVTRLTNGQALSSPVWSPDGRRIAYAARVLRAGKRLWQVLSIPADGSGDAEVLIEGDQAFTTGSFTPDGTGLLYGVGDINERGTDVVLLDLASRTVRVLLAGAVGGADPVVSPDGRWLAMTAKAGEGLFALVVRPFPDGAGRWQVSTGDGHEPRWAPDGSALFYRADAELYRVAVDTSRGFSPGKPERIVDRVSSAGLRHTFGIAPDGRIFTARTPARGGVERTVNLDLGFAARLAALGGEARR